MRISSEELFGRTTKKLPRKNTREPRAVRTRGSRIKSAEVDGTVQGGAVEFTGETVATVNKGQPGKKKGYIFGLGPT